MEHTKDKKWITAGEVRIAAHEGLEAAKKACLVHWREIYINGPVEYREAFNAYKAAVTSEYCALCYMFHDLANNTCGECPLTGDDGGCCDEWCNASTYITADALLGNEANLSWSDDATEAIMALIKRIESITVE
ncbi:MAG: hypothetical protein GY845_25705 [Planctomycetes bacterium]|nr:hypothetical protein [Planctomycetota bacterium]